MSTDWPSSVGDAVSVSSNHLWFDFVDQDKYDRNEPKWVAALRSGRYKQGEGSLLADGKYCCLGVACSAARIPKSPVLGLRIEVKNVVSFGKSKQDSYAPRELAEWLGFDIPHNEYNSEVTICLGNPKPALRAYEQYPGIWRVITQFAELTVLNDELRMPFDKIADLVEKYGVRARWA